MIKIEHLGKHFGKVKAVDDISFEVNEHENLVLLGTSGCGKTTTLKMLNRLIEPTHGKIFINNKNILEQNPELLRRGIGYVLQNNGLFPHYTVAENIAVVPQLLKWDKKKIRHRINELLEKLHLSKDHLSAYPNELSGGQQQRVGLARALVADPPVLLMDEPFGALDNVTKAKIHAEFMALDELKRKTIIMVTHDVQEAFELGDRIGLMDKGKLVQAGTPAELLFKPVNSFVKDFLREQRLQLEFKAIKLRDIWEWLPAPQPSAPSKSPPVGETSPVHRATSLVHEKTLSNSEVKVSPTGGDLEGAGRFDLHDANISFWSGLESFKFTDKEFIIISNHQKDEVKSVGFEQLMSAFYQYKKQQAHE